jgi:hypothetical protein
LKIALVIGAATIAGLAALSSVLPDKNRGALGAVGDQVIFVGRTIACNDIRAYTGRLKQRDHFCKDWTNGGDIGTILQINDRYNVYCINVRDYDLPSGCHWYTDGFTATKK